MKKIYAIIVTYNAMRRGWIDRCIQSVQNSSVAAIPVIIDNGSTDGTREYVPKTYPEVIWLPQEKNLGFGQANNIGIRYALEQHADFVLLLNQDARLHPKAIEYMLNASDGEALISPLQLNGDGTAIDRMFCITLHQAGNELLDDLLIHKTTRDSYQIGDVAAACWFMPISLFHKIGGFNPLFFQYCEDNNYTQRLLYHNIMTLLVPQAVMYHDRNVHGNTQLYNHRFLHRELLLLFCNINLGVFGCLKKLMQELILCYTKRLPQRNYRIGSFSYELGWFFFYQRRIRRSRKVEKLIGKNWL
jgi:GT2 family glycosyltransferase